MWARTAVMGLVSVLLAVGCQDRGRQGEEDANAGSTPAPAPTVAPATVTVQPSSGSHRVRVDQPIRVTVDHGRLLQVLATDGAGERIAGRLDQTRTEWRSTQPLQLGTRYVVRVTVVDRQQQRQTTRSRFHTLDPATELTTAVAPLDGETVGVGMPVQVQLSDDVDNRAAVERALTVDAEPDVAGSWHWLNDRMLRYRPKKFWTPGTRVTLNVALTGVRAGRGLWGAESRQVSFRVGRKMVSVVHEASQTMHVRRRGELVRTIPISDGADGFRTRSGTKVIMLKHRTYDMNSATIGVDPSSAQGYDLADVPYAMRLTNSGEFLHAAPWNTGAFGRVRASHGCIGMSLANARWLFRHSLRGDVVRVVGSPAAPPKVSNGYGGWNLSWRQWKAGSTLAG
jgi:lipoprotein-anchoring transpeptidase ErfK/SrfK